MQSWLRFGLPIGSAFVVAVILDNIIALDCLFKEIVLSTADETSKDFVDSYNYHSDQYPVLYVLIRTGFSVGLWAILVKSPKTALFIWIIGAVAMDSLRHGNLKMIFDALSSFNIYLVVLMPTIRVNLFLIFIEVARVIEKQREPRLLVGSYEGADDDLKSLVPIGYDALGIWRYYERFSVLGAQLLLIVDLMWTLVALPAVKAALGGFAGLVLTLMGSSLDLYVLFSIMQYKANGVVLWRLLHLVFIILMTIAFGSEFIDTRSNPSEQGVISTFTLAAMLIYKLFLFWFTSDLEHSPDLVNPDPDPINANQITQADERQVYQVSEGEWSLVPITTVPGEVIITELDGRDSRGGWDNRSGRVSRASGNPSGWGSQSGIGFASSREGIDSRSGWGSQSAVSESRDGDGGESQSGWNSNSQSVRTSREAITSSVSSVSGWTTASGRESRSDV